MNEEPKSVWKKSWRGWRGLFFGWLILTATLSVIFLIWLAAEGTPINKSGDELKLFVAAGIGMTVIFLVATPIRWLFCRRNFKRFLFGCACFATLIALLYAEEDWRGKHDLEKFKRDWEAKGEKFSFKDFIPPRPPDDQNFAMQPIWVESVKAQLGPKNSRQWFGDNYAENGRTNFVDRLQMDVDFNGDNGWPTNGGNWQLAKLADLKERQNYYRVLATKTNFFPVAPQPQTPAQDVLLALSKYDPAIEELREASKLPYSRFPLEYDKDDPGAILLPHLAMLKRCSQVLRLRAIAELQNGESEKALDDVKLSLYLNQSIRTEPFLISHLVRIAMMEITMQPIYEGLAEHKWSDAQLAELDSELAKLDFLADYQFSMRGERILGMSDTEYLRRSRNFQMLDYSENGSHNGSASHLGLRLAPSAFFYRSELVMARMHQQWILPMVDAEKRIVSPKTVRQNDAAADKELQHGWPYNILARMIFPAFENAVKKYAHEQSSLDLARIAIALERFRLANGNYPDSLDALASQFPEGIPHDIINGGSLKYRRTDDGQFVLYSVGWNETDDGGIVGSDKLRPQDPPNIDKGDWVWRYPKAE